MQSKIKNVQDAFDYLGLDSALPQVSRLPKHQKAILALYQLFIITEALNKEANGGKDWMPTYDGSEWHYFPYFWMDDNGGSGSGFRFYCFGFRIRRSAVGSLLEFISEDVCEYAAETFLELYREAFLLLPQPTSVPVAEQEA